jgi:hypothetical protein
MIVRIIKWSLYIIELVGTTIKSAFTLPSVPSHKGRGGFLLPLPLWERAGEREH